MSVLSEASTFPFIVSPLTMPEMAVRTVISVGMRCHLIIVEVDPVNDIAWQTTPTQARTFRLLTRVESNLPYETPDPP